MEVLIQDCSPEIIVFVYVGKKILALSHNLLQLSPAVVYINKRSHFISFIGQV